MQRIETATRVPDLHGPGKDGFAAGDPLTGTPATSMSPAMWNSLQEELCGLIEAWLGPLDPASYLQLRNAIDARITTALVGSGVSGKVNKAGDGMTGALSIVMSALQLSLQNSTNTATLQDHLRLFRGTGAGTRASLQTLGDAANGLSEIDLNFLSAANVLVKAFKFKNNGRLEVGADPVLPLEVATKQWVEAFTTVPPASAALAGIIEILTNAEAAALTDTTRAMTAANLGFIFARNLADPGYISLPGGAKFQWGRKTSVVNSTDGSGANSLVTFPDAFGTGNYSAVVSLAGNSGGAATNTAAIPVSNSQFKIAGSQAGSNTYSWWAVGKD
tara:strand:- start:7473 stop:8468 length:996 start_codon:yes stop_codon:yes gene_type:complete